MIKRVIIWLFASSMTIFSTSPAIPHTSATGVVKQRMDGMMMLGNQIKLLNPMFINAVPKDFGAMQIAAEMIARHGGVAMSDLFPDGSISGPSEARPEIWSRWQEFQQLALELERLGTELADAAIIAGTALPTQQQPVMLAPELSEWDRLNVAVLLGTKTPQEHQSELDAVILATTPLETAPSSRNPAVIYAEISAVCAACHSAFRR